MAFLKSKVFLITVLLQLAGPFFFSFGNWANVIQYTSGFGMAYAAWEYVNVHRKELQALREQVARLHARHNALHTMLQKVDKE